MLYYMYDIMLYIYYTVLNLLPPITYPPFPKREIYQFTDLPFYHPEKPSDLREVYRKSPDTTSRAYTPLYKRITGT